MRSSRAGSAAHAAVRWGSASAMAAAWAHRLLARAGIRLAAAGHDRKLAAHRRAAARRAVHGEHAAQRLDPVLQPGQPRAPSRVGAAGTVVTHAHPQRAAGGFRIHLDNRSAGVLRRVGEHLRDDVVGGHLDRLGKPAIDPRIYVHRDG